MEIDLSEFDLNQKEERILKAAIKIFSQKGYSAATTSEIARSAEVAEGTVFNYFKTKKEILQRIVTYMSKIMSAEFLAEAETEKSGMNCHEMLKEFIRHKVIFIEGYFPVIRIVITEAIYHKDIREIMFRDVLPKILQVFEKFAAQMKEKHPTGSYEDTFLLVRTIGPQVYALALQHSIFREMGVSFDLETELDKTARLILKGILSEGE